MTVFIPTQHPLLEGPACPPKTKQVLLSAGGPAHLSLKFGMHSCRQGTKGVGRIHITKLETTTPSSGGGRGWVEYTLQNLKHSPPPRRGPGVSRNLISKITNLPNSRLYTNFAKMPQENEFHDPISKMLIFNQKDRTDLKRTEIADIKTLNNDGVAEDNYRRFQNQEFRENAALSFRYNKDVTKRTCPQTQKKHDSIRETPLE